MTKKLKPVADVSRKFSKSVQEKFLQQKKDFENNLWNITHTSNDSVKEKDIKIMYFD